MWLVVQLLTKIVMEIHKQLCVKHVGMMQIQNVRLAQVVVVMNVLVVIADSFWIMVNV